jgi:hypothetical protein
MKKNKRGRITLSDEAYYKYYNEKNFVSLFISSFLGLGRTVIIKIIVFFLLGFMCFIFIDISYIDKPREFILAVSTGMSSYSITTIGFLLVSFTMLVILNDSKSLFRYFALESSSYKKPLIKLLLSIFIIPIGVFILLMIFSMLIGFMLPIFGTQRFSYGEKNLFIKLFVGFIFSLFVFSILEFFSFFYNIYKFIVITSYDTAKNFEQDIINKTNILDKKVVDDGSAEIEKNIRDKVDKLKNENNKGLDV